MLAALSVDGPVSISLPIGGRDHTELLLRRMGAKITVKHPVPGVECISLDGPFQPVAGNWRIPNDPSSAAFLAALPLIHGKGQVTCAATLLNPGRTHFLRVMERMGADIRVDRMRSSDSVGVRYIEDVGDVLVSMPSTLRGTEISAAEAPMVIDEIPILAVVAAFAEGPSVFRGLTELRVKESDRLEQTAALLKKAGCGVGVRDDDLFISPNPRALKPFAFEANGDHRLAMAGAVLMTRCPRPGSEIVGGRCVDVSFPGFFELLGELR
jgi:3-phosphoshikimate 1-carboxyvinyltransferase